MSTSFSGKLFLVVGPSGVGKGTLINRLKKRQPSFIFPPSVTTRPPRKKEDTSGQYKFVNPQEFEKLIQDDELLEWAVVHGTHKYGTLKKPILSAIEAGKIVIREVDIQGLKSIRDQLSSEIFTAIFISPPSLSTLKNRILSRQPTIDSAELKHRLMSAEKELAEKGLADHEVVSKEDGIEDAVAEILKIISQETASLSC